jgi:hypothetical protein
MGFWGDSWVGGWADDWVGGRVGDCDWADGLIGHR